MDAEPSWTWPDDTAPQHEAHTTGEDGMPGGFKEEASPPLESSSMPKPQRQYLPRTCRICFEVVPPTYHPPSVNLPTMLQSKPRVTYESPDPELGRLIRPCKCKGSSRYVHEGCLQSWRHADPDYGRRNYWQCPTCGFQYRLERIRWSRWISSTVAQISLTIAILLSVIFVLGFIADPIINLYVDPYDTISSADFWHPNVIDEEIEGLGRSWTQHLVKGLTSLGVLSFLKVIFALSPWHWWNMRNSGVVIGGGRGRAGGRDRVASISWFVILVGVCTFLWGVFKGVRVWSRRTLEKAGERVMDVPLDDDEDEIDVDDTAQSFKKEN